MGWRADGPIKCALSNLPAATTLEQAVVLWKSRLQVEQGYQQLKDELGLDHFEGHSWPGFHHHATMTFLAYGFLALERARGSPTRLDPRRDRRCARAPALARAPRRIGRLRLPPSAALSSSTTSRRLACLAEDAAPGPEDSPDNSMAT